MEKIQELGHSGEDQNDEMHQTRKEEKRRQDAGRWGMGTRVRSWDWIETQPSPERNKQVGNGQKESGNIQKQSGNSEHSKTIKTPPLHYF